MKHTPLFVLATVAAIGFAVPVVAQQAMGQQGGTGMMGGGMMGDGMMGGGMMGGGMMGGGMMGGGMMGGGMMGPQSYAMRTFDADKDGTLSPEEMTAGMQGELKKYDADTNGTLSLDEFAAMHADHMRPMTVRAFQMHDADGDAQVTEAEMAEMAAMMQAQMSRHHGGVKGMGQGMMDGN
jgi:Ca2+-binding EF-hand superfamily protein